MIPFEELPATVFDSTARPVDRFAQLLKHVRKRPTRLTTKGTVLLSRMDEATFHVLVELVCATDDYETAAEMYSRYAESEKTPEYLKGTCRFFMETATLLLGGEPAEYYVTPSTNYERKDPKAGLLASVTDESMAELHYINEGATSEFHNHFNFSSETAAFLNRHYNELWELLPVEWKSVIDNMSHEQFYDFYDFINEKTTQEVITRLYDYSRCAFAFLPIDVQLAKILVSCYGSEEEHRKFKDVYERPFFGAKGRLVPYGYMPAPVKEDSISALSWSDIIGSGTGWVNFFPGSTAYRLCKAEPDDRDIDCGSVMGNSSDREHVKVAAASLARRLLLCPSDYKDCTSSIRQLSVTAPSICMSLLVCAYSFVKEARESGSEVEVYCLANRSTKFLLAMILLTIDC